MTNAINTWLVTPVDLSTEQKDRLNIHVVSQIELSGGQ